MSGGKIRVTFEADDAAGMFEFCKGFVEGEGYTVEKKRELHAKETPTQFSARMGVSLNSFSRRIRAPHCPQDSIIQWSPSGRSVLWLRASPALEEFFLDGIRRHKGAEFSKPQSAYE